MLHVSLDPAEVARLADTVVGIAVAGLSAPSWAVRASARSGAPVMGGSDAIPETATPAGRLIPEQVIENRLGFLTSHDPVLYRVVGVLRDDLLVHQVVLGFIRAAFDDCLCSRRADLRKRI